MFSVLTKIADIVIQFNSQYDVLPKACKKFEINEGIPEIIINVSEDDLAKEMKDYPVEDYVTPAEYEMTCAFRKLGSVIWKYDTLLFHSAGMKVDDSGIIFSAHSGTGKTTHMRLWKKLLGDRLKAINGDKPFIRFIDDKPVLFGTPWMGKEKFGMNSSAPLQNICFIERSETNYVVKLNKEDIINRIFDQVFLPSDPMGSISTLQLIDKLLNSCNLWCIHCNMDIEAAEVAYNTIFSKQKG